MKRTKKTSKYYVWQHDKIPKIGMRILAKDVSLYKAYTLEPWPDTNWYFQWFVVVSKSVKEIKIFGWNSYYRKYSYTTIDEETSVVEIIPPSGNGKRQIFVALFSRNLFIDYSLSKIST